MPLFLLYVFCNTCSSGRGRLLQEHKRYKEKYYEAQNIMQTQSPEAIDDVIAGLNAGDEEQVDYSQAEEMAGPEGLDMMSQEGAMSVGNVQGMTPETAGEFANPNGMF